jgi:phenylpropionate dioxygenase-like ring-hydroxylating dioxygenase large terminal subunit
VEVERGKTMSTQSQTAELPVNESNRDPVLVDDWHVMARARDVWEGKIMKVRLLGEDLVVWRHEGWVVAWKDL